MELQFPKDFQFGVATSAAQIEGAAFEEGRGMSIWDVYSRIPGTIGDHSTPDDACDFYHRFREDIQQVKKMGLSTFRFSFSWSRIFPEGTGSVNPKGVAFYKQMIEELRKNDIMPNATLYHWDLPYELERKGGWLNRDCVQWYADYAEFMFREFGSEVPLWATFNEPIANYVGYAMGSFAPGKNLERYGRCANHHLLLAHGEAVRRFRKVNPQGAKIGIVIDIWNRHPFRKDSKEDQMLAALENAKAHEAYLAPIFLGEYPELLLEFMREENCMPEIREGDLESIHEPLDFYGLNCYNRVVVCSDEALLQKDIDEKIQGGNFLDNGSEFYPKAVYDAVKILKEKYHVAIPIYITENGLPNCQETVLKGGSIHDTQRIDYMKGFLYWIYRAMQEGADIRGYYAWSLLDNWEWTAGYASRFGLIHVDFDTQQRIMKDSGYWYADFARKKKLEVQPELYIPR